MDFFFISIAMLYTIRFQNEGNCNNCKWNEKNLWQYSNGQSSHARVTPEQWMYFACVHGTKTLIGCSRWWAEYRAQVHYNPIT